MKFICKGSLFLGLTQRNAEASVVGQHGEEGEVQTGDLLWNIAQNFYNWIDGSRGQSVD